MMSPDTSEQGVRSFTDPSKIDSDGNEGMVTLDMGNTASVILPEHEIESMQASRPKYRKWLVFTVIGLALLAIVMISVLIGVSTSSAKKSSHSSSSSSNANDATTLTIADDSGNTNGGAIDTGLNSTEGSTALTSTSAPNTASQQTLPPSTRQGCLSDRFDNENMAENSRLYPGQYICSMDETRQYQFGLTTSADLIYKDTATNETLLLFKNPYKKGKLTSNKVHPLEYYFSLTINGTFVMNMLNKTDPNAEWNPLWEAKPVYEIKLTENCLPHHDCPYLHIHQGGVVILNWIGYTINTGNALAVGGDDNWQTQNFLKIYTFDYV
jgi:hypothetical protein